MSNTPPPTQWPPQPPTPPPGGAYPPQQPPYPSAPPPLNVPQGYPGAYQSGPVGSPMGSFGGPSFVVARRSGSAFFKFILLASILVPAVGGFLIWRAASHDASTARNEVNSAIDKATKTANKALDDAQKQIDAATKKASDASKKAGDAAKKAGADVSTAVSDATGSLDTTVTTDGSSNNEGTDQGTSGDAGTVNLFAGTGAGDAVAAIAEARAADPLKALEVNLYPEYVIAQVQDPNTPANVDEFMFRDSQVSDPNPVKLVGDGDLESNLFATNEVNWGAVPGLVAAALQQINIEGGQVTHIHISRNLPFTSDIQIRVFVDGTRQDGYLDADAKGNITNVTVN